MQLAVLADIHGNLPALEAILNKLRSETIDGWIVAGDMVNGPDGEQVIHVLRELDAWMILGNNEQYMLRYAHGNASAAWLTAQQFAFVRNCYRRLSAETLQILAGLPEQRLLSFDGTDPIRIIHGSLENVNGLVDPAQPETIDRLFGGLVENTVVCGHLHLPWIRRRDNKLALNPGAVTGGLNGDPRAQYALLRWNGKAWQAQLKGVKYDHADLHRSLIKSGLMAEAKPLALAFLLSCQTGQDHWIGFLKYAQKTAALAGHQDPDVIPDDIWAAAGETYFASYP